MDTPKKLRVVIPRRPLPSSPDGRPSTPTPLTQRSNAGFGEALMRRLDMEEDEESSTPNPIAQFARACGKALMEHLANEGRSTNKKRKMDDAATTNKKQERPAGINNPFLVAPITKYINSMRELGRNDTIVADYQQRPEVCNLLSGEVAAMVQAENGPVYPLVVKQIYQSRSSDPKPVESVAMERQPDFYLEPINRVGASWRVKPGSKLFYECQNICASLNAANLVVLCYCPRGGDFMSVDFAFDAAEFKACYEQLTEVLIGNNRLE